jgi:hypothetical protein
MLGFLHEVYFYQYTVICFVSIRDEFGICTVVGLKRTLVEAKITNNLFKKQKAAIRIVCNEKYSAHPEPLFKSMEILPLSSLIEFLCKRPPSTLL